MLRVVPDANRIAAALLHPSGWSSRQLQRTDIEFYVPAYLFEELNDHASDYIAKAQVSAASWRSRVQELRDAVIVVPEEHLLAHAQDPLVQICLDVDPDDAAYLATVCAVDADFFWTNDDAIWRAFRSICCRLIPEA